MEPNEDIRKSRPGFLGAHGWQLGALFAILVASFCLNYLNNDFPNSYHVDEKSKAQAILEAKYNFNHPALMLQVNRAVRHFTGFTDRQSIVETGRTVSAVFGVVIALATFLFSSRIIGRNSALLVCAAAAFAPSIVVHSHYLKEDATFTAFTTLSIFAFLLFMEKKSRWRTLALGVATGLAFSSKYPGFLLILIYLLAPVVCSFEQKRRTYRLLGLALAAAMAVFLLMNYPMFFGMEQFKKGVSFEANHTLRGHVTQIYPLPHFFAFHLMNSIVPGTSIFVSALAVLYIPWMALQWRAIDAREKFLMLFLVVFYLAIEITPQKGFPGFPRYALPCIPPVLFFAYRSLGALAGAVMRGRKFKFVEQALFAVAVAHLLYQSAAFTYYMNRDTRKELEAWLDKNPWPVIAEYYTAGRKKYKTLYKITSKGIPRDVKYLIASSFTYERYLYGVDLKGQTDEVYRIGAFYQKLLKHTTKEIRPAYKSFANTNPTIKIIEVTDSLRSELEKSYPRMVN